MSFVNLVMLAGLAGIGIPLMLHLLSRARYRSLDWGAMMFLVGADRRQRWNMRLRQWLLLALRMLLVALVALAMARPRLSSSLPGNVGGSDLAVVIAIDCSASMAVQENGRRRMDDAKAAAIAILKRLQRGDEVTLLTPGSDAAGQPITGDLPTLARHIADLQPGQQCTDMLIAAARAAQLLEQAVASSREIYLIGDQQDRNWPLADDAAWNQWQAMQHQLRVFYVPVGGRETYNVAITRVEAVNPPLVAGQTAEIELHLHNFGAAPAVDLGVQLREDTRKLFDTSVTLAGNANTVLRTQARFTRPGPHLLSASVTATDAMASDNSRELALWVRTPIPVLMVSGDEREGPFRRESDFLRLALAPWKAAGKPGTDPADVSAVTSEQWPPLDAGKTPVLVLANVSQLSQTRARELEQFVYSGGGLLITAGALLQPESYNRLLYRDGSGILPGRFGEPFAPSAAISTSVLGADLSHPALQFVRNRPDTVPAAAIARYIPITMTHPEARVLMTLQNGQPLLLEKRSGKGTVLLFTSSIDADWNSLPLSSFYLPLAQSLTRYLAGDPPQLNLLPGEPLVLAIRGAPSSVTVACPDGRRESAALYRSGALTEVRYGRTDSTGRYTVIARSGNEEQRWMAVVATPPDEANLQALTEERLASLQKRGVVTLQTPQIEEQIGRHRLGRELWLPLLIAAFAVALAELLVSRLWTKGAPPTAGSAPWSVPSSVTRR